MIPQCAGQGPKSVRRSGDVRPFSIFNAPQAGRKLEWQSRKRLYGSFRVRTTGVPWHARGAPVDFHLRGTVRPRINKNSSCYTRIY
jgi:hypothetical protein